MDAQSLKCQTRTPFATSICRGALLIFALLAVSACQPRADGTRSKATNVEGSGNLIVMGDLIVNKSVGPGCSSGVRADTTAQDTNRTEIGGQSDAGGATVTATGDTSGAAAGLFASLDECTKVETSSGKPEAEATPLTVPGERIK